MKNNKLKTTIELRWLAKRLGFPIHINDVYIYGARTTCGRNVFAAWAEQTKHGAYSDPSVAPVPLRHNCEHVGVYHCYNIYSKGYQGSDYAPGDSGLHGDYKLIRIDTVPALKQFSADLVIGHLVEIARAAQKLDGCISRAETNSRGAEFSKAMVALRNNLSHLHNIPSLWQEPGDGSIAQKTANFLEARRYLVLSKRDRWMIWLNNWEPGIAFVAGFLTCFAITALGILCLVAKPIKAIIASFHS